MNHRKHAVAAALAALLAAAGPGLAATDPLAPPANGKVDLGGGADAGAKTAPKPPAKHRRVVRRRMHHRPTELGAQTVPDIGRPAITGVTILGPAVRDYPTLAPEPRDDAAALTPAFYLGGIARFVTQPPPPPECRPQRRDDAGRPGYVRNAPLYCAEFDP